VISLWNTRGRRTNPRGSSRANNGIDLAAFTGMSVHASAAGA
jgi:murein DD-endopeptidase MepM/ murein hydrolase activator NlpD